MKKINHPVLLLLFFICCHINFSEAQEREKALNTFFSAIDKNGDVSGSVFIAENGKVLYQQSFGYADAEHKIPNSANTLFQIASASKLFTAIAVLQLYEQKKLDLNDKFAKYFQDFPYPDVTIRQILSNTSGMPNTVEVFVPLWRLNRDTIFTLNDVIPALKRAKLPLNFKPGENWDYSNTNYSLLAVLVEKVSGLNFGDYLSKNVFKPAGMKSTFQKASGADPYTHSNVAYNYALPFRLSITPVRVDSFAVAEYKVNYRTWPAEGDANIYTCVTDLVNFDKALYNGRLLKPKTLDMAFSPSTRNNGKKIILEGLESEIGVIGNFYWGFGNRISLDSAKGKIVWESGGMPGCSANIISNLSKHQLLIWLDNKQSISAMDNIFGALAIINNKAAAVKTAKKSVANTYGQLLLQYGQDRAFIKLTEMKADTVSYRLDEGEFNEVGYEFLGNNKTDIALEVFRTALLLFPNSDNLFNSYGELLAKMGEKDEAIMMYKKSLLLNAKNEDSKKALANLEKK